MARVNNLSNFLTDVADAIKEKKGSQTSIPAANFDTEILALPSQGTYEQRVLNISANGTQTITPSSGFDAIDELELTVAVPEKQLQSKTYNFTQNTTIQLLPDTGYDGFDVVTLNINVPSGEINNQDKTITENGTYTADEGYTGLGEVNVSVPFPVKLFENKTLMDADEDKNISDKAVVYGDETITWDGSEVQSVTILQNVTVPNEVTSTINNTWDMSNNGKIALTPTSCTITYRDSRNWRNVTITYTSEDGIHYVGDTADTTYTVRWGSIMSYNLTNECKAFFAITDKAFNGLFECHEVDDISRITCVDSTNIVVTSSGITTSTHTINIGDILSKIVAKHKSEGLGTLSDMLVAITGRDGDTITEVVYHQGSSYAYYSNSQWLYRAFTTSTVTPQKFYKYNIVNDTFEVITQTPTLVLTSGSYKHYVGYNVGLNDIFYVYHNYTRDTFTTQGNIYYYGYANNTYYSLSGKDTFPKILRYEYISTQLSDVKPNDLVNDMTVYGKNGVVKSDGTIWERVPPIKYFEKMYGLTFDKSSYGTENHYTWPGSSTTDLAFLPYANNNTNIKYIKHTSLSNDCTLYGGKTLDSTYSNMYTLDGLYMIQSSGVDKIITNTQTKETWTYTADTTGYGTRIIGHKMYLCKDVTVTSGKSYTIYIIVYDLDTKSVETNFSQTITASGTFPTSGGYYGGLTIYPGSDTVVFMHYAYVSTNEYSGFFCAGKLSTISSTKMKMVRDDTSTHIASRYNLRHTTSGTFLMHIKQANSTFNLYEYDLANGTLLHTFTNVPEDFIGNVAYKENNNLYIAGSSTNYEFHYSNHTYEEFSGNVPSSINTLNGALYSSTSDTNNNSLYVQVFNGLTIIHSFYKPLGNISLYNNEASHKTYSTSSGTYYDIQGEIVRFVNTDTNTIFEYKPYILGTVNDCECVMLPAVCSDTEFFNGYKECKPLINNLAEEVNSEEVTNGENE